MKAGIAQLVQCERAVSTRLVSLRSGTQPRSTAAQRALPHAGCDPVSQATSQSQGEHSDRKEQHAELQRPEQGSKAEHRHSKVFRAAWKDPDKAALETEAVQVLPRLLKEAAAAAALQHPKPASITIWAKAKAMVHTGHNPSSEFKRLAQACSQVSIASEAYSRVQKNNVSSHNRKVS